jgi:outer membrane biosynthesis protein TonB
LVQDNREDDNNPPAEVLVESGEAARGRPDLLEDVHDDHDDHGNQHNYEGQHSHEDHNSHEDRDGGHEEYHSHNGLDSRDVAEDIQYIDANKSDTEEEERELEGEQEGEREREKEQKKKSEKREDSSESEEKEGESVEAIHVEKVESPPKKKGEKSKSKEQKKKDKEEMKKKREEEKRWKEEQKKKQKEEKKKEAERKRQEEKIKKSATKKKTEEAAPSLRGDDPHGYHSDHSDLSGSEQAEGRTNGGGTKVGWSSSCLNTIRLAHCLKVQFSKLLWLGSIHNPDKLES